jgi:hypothetical protein
MTIVRDEDLQVAVAEGIVTEAQVASLRELANKRETARAVELGHEERFRFMRGFNDFFFAVGIVLFAGGLAFFALPTPAGSLVAVVFTWLLAELLVGRLRLVLPGILLVVIFALFVMAAAPVDFWFTTRGQGLHFDALREWFTAKRFTGPYSNVTISAFIIFGLYALVGAGAGLLFYVRFRLPFALLVIAACLVATVVAGVYHLWMWPGVQQPWSFPPPHVRALTLLCCGLLTFMAAMAFDFSDRERLTRRADCAFWLHLLAAPLIVHSLISLAVPDYATAMTTPVAMAILAIFAVLTIVAIVIDRRALLVSALLYVGVVVAYGLRTTSFVGQQSDQFFVLFATLFVLGALVLTLGVGWRPLRRLFVRLLPAMLGRRLPPVAAPA